MPLLCAAHRQLLGRYTRVHRTRRHTRCALAAVRGRARRRSGAERPSPPCPPAPPFHFPLSFIILPPLFSTFFFPLSLLPAGRGVTRGDNSPPPQAMSSVRIECVAKEGCRIGESPVWDEKEGALLFVDITGRKVCRWSPLTLQTQAIPVGKEPLENPAPCAGAACWGSAWVPRQLWAAHLLCSLAFLVASTLGDARYRPDLVLRTFPTMFYYWLCLFLFPIRCPQLVLFCSHFVPLLLVSAVTLMWMINAHNIFCIERRFPVPI